MAINTFHQRVRVKAVKPANNISRNRDEEDFRPRLNEIKPTVEAAFAVQCDFGCKKEVSKKRFTFGEAADEARKFGFITVPGLRLTDPSNWCCSSEQCRKKAQAQKNKAA